MKHASHGQDAIMLHILLLPWLYAAMLLLHKSHRSRQPSPILRTKAPIPDTAWEKNTAALVAASSRRWGRVFRLLDHGASANYSKEYTILQHAVMQRKYTAVKRLLEEFYANPNKTGYHSHMLSPLIMAIQHGHYPMVQLLLKNGAIPTPASLFLAIRDGRKCMVALLLFYGADPNACVQLNDDEDTINVCVPVSYAVLPRRKSTMVPLLYDYGLQPMLTGNTGRTLLDMAKETTGCEYVIEALEKLM